MFLSRIHLDPRSREARRDLADPYQMHATLCRVFSPPDSPCPPGTFLWRLEPETDAAGCPRLLIQSREHPQGLTSLPWLASMPDPAIDLRARLGLEALTPGRRFRFRLRANASTSRNGKRVGLLSPAEQQTWIDRQGRERQGFQILDRPGFDLEPGAPPCLEVEVSQSQMLRCRQHDGNAIQVFSVLFNGLLAVTHPEAFRKALQNGIGHGKAVGLGLLSVVPMP